MANLEPGTYKGRIKDYGFSQPKDASKNPSAMVQFQLDIPDPAFSDVRHADITWFGSFNGGALKITLDTLVNTLGFTGNTGAELANGIGSNVLIEDRDYEIVVENNEYNGKTSLRVKYINVPGATRKGEKLDAGAAAVFAGGLNLGAELAALRQGKPAPARPTPQPGFQPTPLNKNEKLPF